MGIIKQLPLQEAQKIAAGEVVERPASIVKELIENALDAGATTIDVYIEEGGKSLIRLIDNGCGMASDDAHACFLPHATSKITCVDDLERLISFGFRGEALASVAAVSYVELKTRRATDEAGSCVMSEFGIVTSQLPVGIACGTDITITRLFDNIPARKKFLKTIDTEWRQITNLMQAYTLAFKSVHFRLFHHNQLVYNCPAVADLATRVHQLWDEATSRSLLTIDKDSEYGHLSGSISNHQFMRYARSHIFLFINNRWVRNNNIVKALLKGYENVLQSGKFPAAFLYLRVDPSQVDVNIHPRKEEVQLASAKQLEALVYSSTKEALASIVRAQSPSLSFMPAIPAYAEGFPQETPTTSISTGSSIIAAIKSPLQAPSSAINAQALIDEQPFMFAEPFAEQQNVVTGDQFSILAQLHKTYILVEKNDGLWMVDQHAAHERILYESFKNRFNEVAATRLLFPQRVHFDKIDCSLLVPYLPLLQAEGLEVEQFNPTQLVVYATPTYAKNLDFQDFFAQCLRNVRDLAHLDTAQVFKELRERLHATMACKAAIKAGDQLETVQMHELIATLEKTENKLTCPHGRPTSWTLSSYDIEKNFKRIL